MSPRTLLRVAVLVAFPASGLATLVNSRFDASFTASESLWSGPSAEFDFTDRTPWRSFGAYYTVRGSTGVVTASQTGTISAVHPDVHVAGSPVPITLDFEGQPGGGSLESTLGAELEAGVYVNVNRCLLRAFGRCILRLRINETYPLLDEGFFLNPIATFTPVLDSPAKAWDSDTLAEASLVASLAIDFDQQLTFTPTAMSGLMLFENTTYGGSFLKPFSILDDDMLRLYQDLSVGLWRVSLLNVILSNHFRTDIDLTLRAGVDLGLVSFPIASYSVPLLHSTKELSFNPIEDAGSFYVRVIIPEPGTYLLCGLALILAGLYRRRSGPRTPLSRL